LRAEVGEDIFTSWFARMDLEAIDTETVRQSVPTRFLKSWIQAHYGERVLTCWQAEEPSLRKIDIAVRSAVIRTTSTSAKAPEPVAAARESRDIRVEAAEPRGFGAPVSSTTRRSAARRSTRGSPSSPS
jgi:chromosomal replication initiator protein